MDNEGCWTISSTTYPTTKPTDMTQTFLTFPVLHFAIALVAGITLWLFIGGIVRIAGDRGGKIRALAGAVLILSETGLFLWANGLVDERHEKILLTGAFQNGREYCLVQECVHPGWPDAYVFLMYVRNAERDWICHVVRWSCPPVSAASVHMGSPLPDLVNESREQHVVVDCKQGLIGEFLLRSPDVGPNRIPNGRIARIGRPTSTDGKEMGWLPSEMEPSDILEWLQTNRMPFAPPCEARSSILWTSPSTVPTSSFPISDVRLPPSPVKSTRHCPPTPNATNVHQHQCQCQSPAAARPRGIDIDIDH